MILKKYSKHILFILLILLTSFGFSTTAKADNYYEGFYYNSDGIITNYDGTDSIVVVPATINGTKITGIGVQAFYDDFTNQDDDKTFIEKIILPDSIATIGSYAFCNCRGLCEINLPKNITSIGECAFSNCCNLGKIRYNVPNLNISKRNYALFDNAGTNTGNSTSILPAPLEIIFESDVKTIPSYIFNNNPNLKKIFLSDNITEIGNSAFENCTNLSDITWNQSLEKISTCAFQNCYSIKDITLPKTMRLIESHAFDSCIGAKTISIPNFVSSIDYAAFANCKNLIKINYDSEDIQSFYTGNNIFLNAGSNSSVLDVYFGDNVVKIPDYIFDNVSSLSQITFSDSVNYIGSYAFNNCRALNNIRWNKEIKEIHRNAFCNCSSLTDMQLPDKLTDINESAFEGCDAIKTLTIPSTVSYIAPRAFFGLEKVNKIYYNTPKINEYLLNNCIFQNAGLLSNSLELIIGDDVKKIPNCMFNTNNKLTKLTMSDSIVTVGAFAFVNCANLASIKWSKNLESIETSAFENNLKLKEITLPSKTEKLDDSAFIGCSNLTKIRIPKTVTSIGINTFKDCPSLVAYVYKNSKADTYAKNNDITRKYINTTPTDVKASSEGVQSVKVSWKKVSDVSKYKVYYCDSENGSYKSTTTTNTSITIKKLTPNKKYYFYVVALSKNSSYVDSDKSKKVTATPKLKKVSLSSAKATSSSKIKLTWKKNTECSGYEIYRSDKEKGEYKKIKTITSKNTTTYTNSSLKANKKYYYKIRAYKTISNKKVYSEYSSIKNATTKKAPKKKTTTKKTTTKTTAKKATKSTTKKATTKSTTKKASTKK